MQFLTLRYVDPATYQIMGNLKIVTTGVLFRLFLRRRLSLLQWIALTLLMIGAATSQVGCKRKRCQLSLLALSGDSLKSGTIVGSSGPCMLTFCACILCRSAPAPQPRQPSRHQSRCAVIAPFDGHLLLEPGQHFELHVHRSACPQGYLFGLLSAFLSALAAVYTEWVMKRNGDSLYWQNMQLYAWGVLINGLGLSLADARDGFQVRHASGSDLIRCLSLSLCKIMCCSRAHRRPTEK